MNNTEKKMQEGDAVSINRVKLGTNTKDMTKFVVTAAVLIALTLIMGYFPFVFLIPLLFTCTTQKFWMSMFMALVFGLVSVMYAFTGGASLVALAFIQLPWIPIVPRLFVGLFAFLSFHGAKRLLKKDNKLCKILPYSISASVGILTNTTLVVACFVIFLPTLEFGGVTMLSTVPLMLISGAIELLVANVIVPPLSITVSKAMKFGEFGLKSA